MIRVSVVSYLNSKPFVAGLTQNSIINKIDLSLDIPSTCAEKLINGKTDIGLIPVAVLPLVKNAQVITPFCIAS
ncbi:MAG: radical SAM protein, partial [Ignavibacteria bacterium]|nr:radical SAM protein [Ignavibacteria bacterium]